MANTKDANVIIVDTSAMFVNAKAICGIKYIGAASGTATIKTESSSGVTVWEEAGASNVWNPECEIRSSTGVYVTIGSGAKVYLYLK